MYYVVKKFPNLSKAIIHLGTHLHLVIKGMCKESFEEMKNTVVNKVCHMPITTSLAIVLSANNFFLSLFVQWGWRRFYGIVKAKKLNQMLKFVPLCSPNIHNLIASLKHHFDNPSFFDYILELKALFVYDDIHDNYFLGQQVRQKVYLFKIELYLDFIWFSECNRVTICKMCEWCSIT
jgi:hypothetical protein